MKRRINKCTDYSDYVGYLLSLSLFGRHVNSAGQLLQLCDMDPWKIAMTHCDNLSMKLCRQIYPNSCVVSLPLPFLTRKRVFCQFKLVQIPSHLKLQIPNCLNLHKSPRSFSGLQSSPVLPAKKKKELHSQYSSCRYSWKMQFSKRISFTQFHFPCILDSSEPGRE